MADRNNIQKPLNVTEEYLYGINVRLEILIDMMSSLLEAYADKHELAVEKNVKKDPVKETKPKTTKKKKGTKKEGA